MARNGSCWDTGPDTCPGCTYCAEARATPPGEPVYYPSEQAARDEQLANQAVAIKALMDIAWPPTPRPFPEGIY